MSMDGKIGLDNAFSDVLSKRSLLILALFWGGSILLVVSYGTVSGRLRGPGCPSIVAGPMPGANETGAFSAWRSEAKSESRPSYRVVFDNLSSRNRALGVFRTASHKRVDIDNLHVAFIAPEASSRESVRLQDFCDLFAPRSEGRSREKPLGVIDEFEASTADWSVGVDLTNATEVRIRELEWTICHGELTALKVQSRYACLRADSPDVVLRGHATVATPSATLESNCIRMDVHGECFVVEGRYVLTRGGCKETGLGACFDRALGPVEAGPSNTGENGTWADGLQRGAF